MDNNLFLYLIVFLFTLTLTVLMGRLIIPNLSMRAKQPIYEEGPEWHMSKSGTPTMGGLAFLISVSVALILCVLLQHILGNTERALSMLICAVYSILNASVGIIDDLTKLKHKKNAGLSPKAKLIMQFISAILFLGARQIFIDEGTSFYFSFFEVDIPVLYYALSLIILVGITNCANLTDGVDGLASSVAFAIGISSFYLSYTRFDNTSFIAAMLSAAAVGFLIFNIHPAKVFMGDTGSLFFGALASSLAFELGNPFFAVISGGVYVIEGISVILQVLFFKICGKRIFKMAPIHHHLEKCGWDENKICLCAMILTLLLSVPAFLLCTR